MSAGARRFSQALRLLVPASLALGACQLEPEPATAIVVSVMTDLAIGTELTSVTYRVFDKDADPEFDQPVAEFSASADTLHQPFVIKKRVADEFLLSVEGSDGPATPPRVVYRAFARFEKGKTLAARVFLARACAERPSCMFGGMTCYGEPRGDIRAGVCAAVPEAELSEVKVAGEESLWEPMRSPSLDGGPSIVSAPRPPFPGNPWDAGVCSAIRPGVPGSIATCVASERL